MSQNITHIEEKLRTRRNLFVAFMGMVTTLVGAGFMFLKK